MEPRPRRPRDANQLAKLITDIATGEAPSDEERAETPATQAGRKGGKKGGTKRMDSLTAEERKALALKAARARWSKR